MYLDRYKKWIVIGFLVIFLGYGIFESYKLILGPKIVVNEPENGRYFENPLVVVAGYARNISFITLNDRQIFVDKSGNFNEKLILSPGYNIIILKAKDRLGKDTIKKMEFFLKRPEEKIIEEREIPEEEKTATSTKSIDSNTATTSASSTNKIRNRVEIIEE